MFIDELEEQINEIIFDYFANKSEITSNRHRIQLSHFYRFIEACDYQEINNDVLEHYKKILNRNYKDSTYNLFVVSINKLIKKYYPHLNKFKRKKLLVTNKVENLISKEEFNLLAINAKRFGFETLYYIMMTLYYTGMRVSELKFLKVDNYNLKSFEVTSKRRTRNVYISNELSILLSKYIRKYKPRTYIFYSPINWQVPISTRTIQKQMKEVAYYSGISQTHVCPSAIRHLFAREFLNINGASIIDLAEIMGNNRLEIIKGYTSCDYDIKDRYKLIDEL